jgi:hypothetical protein
MKIATKMTNRVLPTTTKLQVNTISPTKIRIVLVEIEIEIEAGAPGEASCASL